MTNPSHLKVRYLFELPELPPGEVENSWTYTYVPNGPDKDYKVFLPTLIEEAADQVVSDVKQDLLSTDDGLGTDMLMYKLDSTNNTVDRLLRGRLSDIPTLNDFGQTVDEAVVNANTHTVKDVYVPEGTHISSTAPTFRIRGPGKIVVDGRVYEEADWMFGGVDSRRTKRRVLGNYAMIFPDFAAAATAAGEDPTQGLYPQSFCIDWEQSHLYVVFSGSSATSHVVVIYNLYTSEYISCFIVPYYLAAGGCYIRKRGGEKVFGIHVNGNIAEYIVDPLPANISSPTPAALLPFEFSYQFSYNPRNDTVALEESLVPRAGQHRRFMLSVYDMDGGFIDRIRLPISMSSGRASEDLLETLPKRQGFAFNGTHIAGGHGGLWRTAHEPPITPYKFNGVSLMAADGSLLEHVCYWPDKLRLQLQDVLGRTVTRIENEGVILSPDGRVITLTIYLGHVGGNPQTGGLLLMEEFSEHPDAIDFGECEAPWPLVGADNSMAGPSLVRNGTSVANCFYRNPVNSNPITSWSDLAQMMASFDMAEAGYYSTFDGDGGAVSGGIQTPLGGRIPNTHYVHFTNLSNERFLVRVTGDTMHGVWLYELTPNTATPILDFMGRGIQGITPVADANDVRFPQGSGLTVGALGSSSANAPTTGVFHTLSLSVNGTSYSQIALRYGNPSTAANMYYRHGNTNGDGPWMQVVNTEMLSDGRVSNGNTTFAAGDINNVVEKSNNSNYTYTIPAGFGSDRNKILVVNSGTAGNITIARGSGVALYEGATDADVTVGPGTACWIMRSSTADRWIAIR